MNKSILHYTWRFFTSTWIFLPLMLVVFALVPTYICTYFAVTLTTYVFYMFLSGVLCGCILTLKDEMKYREKCVEVCAKKLQEQEEYWQNQLKQLGSDIVKELQRKV